ncbi:MAG: hypothetical protein JO317_08025, partial [Verrucomicrobiae bacterium]|nr:hypothetical protein [Verrucomicrobiae bacterium]
MAAPNSWKSKASERVLKGERQPFEPVIGMEAEFTLLVDGKAVRPERIFKAPKDVVRSEMLPRAGRSRHLPSGGALYFDSGVIEVATPIIELGERCAVRVARSLWEQIAFLRGELDHHEERLGKKLQLEGFSTHYNLTFTPGIERHGRSLPQLAILLAFLLPVPVMLLTANRRTTGVGVRPRPGRLEVTADFTPDPPLMTAAAAFIAGVVCEIMEWDTYRLAELEDRALPVIQSFWPCKHSTRKGWVARPFCFERNPYTADVNESNWRLRDGRRLSLRRIAREIAKPFRESIRRMADEETFEHVFAVFDGRARSLLDFEDRPAGYCDVGRTIRWTRRAARKLPRSRYEKVIHDVITRRRVRMGR